MTCAATGEKRFFLYTNYHEFTLNYFKGGLWHFYGQFMANQLSFQGRDAQKN
jgi:hypothetical protein